MVKRKLFMGGITGIVLMLTVFSTMAFAVDVATVSGFTKPAREVTLSMDLTGRISKIFFREGDFVKKGQTILRFRNNLERLEVQRRKLIWESQVEVESAIAREKTLRSILNSTRTLFEGSGSVSREELEKLTLEYELAVADRIRLQTLELREKIEYDIALENLEKRILRSPMDGVISRIFMEEGEVCEAPTPIVHIASVRTCLFVCNMEEVQGRSLKKGQAVELSIRVGRDEQPRKANVVFVSPVVDPASGLMEVKAEFDNRDGSVTPGVAGSMRVMPAQ